MGSLQRNAKYLVTFLLGLPALAMGASAPAHMTYPDRLGPDKGGFDWTQFEGKYDFSDCLSHPSAIWGDSPPDTFVQIDHKIAYTSDPMTEGLDLMRANNRSPLALGWSVERVGQGRRTENDADTGMVRRVMESYATADGIYGMIAWNRPSNVGWSTLQLRTDALGKVSFTIRQRTDSDSSTREETCTLKKRVPRIHA